ncbi:MAG: O-methyltransferase [Devosia sp.]
MAQQTWSEVDRYIGEHLLSDADPVFEEILKANAAGGLPAIDVSPAQGKFLNLLVKIAGATRILEIGTLGGYSTVWMASALQTGGRLLTLEYAPKHAEVAKANIARAGLSDRVEVRTGAALDLLPILADEGGELFDLTFIDADKPNNPRYLEWALKLTRKGGVVILDNVVRGGRVVEAASGEPSIWGTRAAFELLKRHANLDATALQTVGLKGYDGLIIGVVR